MAVDTKKYLEELLSEAGVSDDNVKQAVSNFFGNEKVAKRIGDDIMRQQDYSRNMDVLKADQKKTSDYYTQLLNWKAEQERVLAEAQPQPIVQQVQPDFTKFQEELNKSWEKKLADRDGQFIGLLKVGMNLASRHAVEFKEPLDTAAVEKIAVEKSLPLAQAYDEYVAPRRTEAQAAARKAELDRAREEAVRDFASTHKIPVDTRPAEYHTLFDRDPKKQVGVDDYVPGTGDLSQRANDVLRNNFADAWNSATAGTSGK